MATRTPITKTTFDRFMGMHRVNGLQMHCYTKDGVNCTQFFSRSAVAPTILQAGNKFFTLTRA